ncbi:hypothetical protein TNCV_1715111 [Trichonephila clavipes]|nr:hypothetical protein TNCV_1715111 [Trichonephila clavipes]
MADAMDGRSIPFSMLDAHRVTLVTQMSVVLSQRFLFFFARIQNIGQKTLNAFRETAAPLDNTAFVKFVMKICKGCGSPVVKVSDHGRHVMSSSPVPLKTRRIETRRESLWRKLQFITEVDLVPILFHPRMVLTAAELRDCPEKLRKVDTHRCFPRVKTPLIKPSIHCLSRPLLKKQQRGFGMAIYQSYLYGPKHLKPLRKPTQIL